MSFLRDPQRFVVTLIVGVVGLFVLIDFAAPNPLIAPIARALIDGAAVVSAVALLIGLFSVAGSHVGRVRQRQSDWGYSLILLAAMLTVIIVGVFVPVGGQLPANLAERTIRDFFRAVYEPLAVSLLALLAFFSLSAALRTFRRGRGEAMAIVVIAFFVLLLQLPPLAALPYLGAGLAVVQDLIALAGARALLLGSAIGAMIAAVRILLGFDQPYLDR